VRGIPNQGHSNHAGKRKSCKKEKEEDSDDDEELLMANKLNLLSNGVISIDSPILADQQFGHLSSIIVEDDALVCFPCLHLSSSRQFKHC